MVNIDELNIDTLNTLASESRDRYGALVSRMRRTLDDTPIQTPSLGLILIGLAKEIYREEEFLQHLLKAMGKYDNKN